ncbi:MAG: glycosyltransferase family 4 protein [Nitrososphaerota archaeon]
MRFVVVADSFEKVKGGIENQARILFNLISSTSHKVVFIDYSELNKNTFSKGDVVIIEGIHRPKLFKLLFYRTPCYKIIFTHGSFYAWTDHPRVSFKGSGTNFLKIKRVFDLLFMKRILNKFDMIVTLSMRESADLAKMFGIVQQKFFSLGNFSDEPPSSGEQDKVKDLPSGDYACYVGRLDERKNLIELLKAAAQQDIDVVMAGQDQGMLNKLLNYCETHNFKKFHYEGVVDEATKFRIIQNSRFAVIPSFFEGLPTFAIEAIKCKKNVIVTKNCYMDPHPCVIFTETNFEAISIAIEKALVKTPCNIGYDSNNSLFERFLKTVEENVSKGE